jgi:hypothetical protein
VRVIRALGVVCDAGHDFVTLEAAKARMHKENHDRHMHSCRPHRIVRLVDITTLTATLRGAMRRHRCNKRTCDVCLWAAHVIGMIWKKT